MITAEEEHTDQFVNLAYVVKTIGVSRATIYRLIANGDFPSCIKLSDRSKKTKALWPLSLVNKFRSSLIDKQAEKDSFYKELKNAGN